MEAPQQAVVSVIIPVYNAAIYLKACIESVLAQSLPTFELILIDDGSQDDSLAICQEYQQKDSRVKVFSQNNAGPGAARNKGIEVACAPWLCFVDSDDVIGPDYLRAFWEQGALTPTTLVIQGMQVMTEDLQTQLSVLKYPRETITMATAPQLIPQYKLLHAGHPVLKLFNTNLIHQYALCFDASISFHEDHLFVLSYMQHVDRIHLCPATEYLYRQSSGSLTHRLHPYTESERALKYLDKSFKDVSEHFTIKSTSYEREINAFLCSTLFRTIAYAYRGAVSNQEELELLRRLAEYRTQVTSADIRRPISLRVIRWIYLYLPKTLQHVIFSTFYYLR